MGDCVAKSANDLAALIAEELDYLTLEERAECLQGLERQAKIEANFNALRAINIYRSSAAWCEPDEARQSD